VYGIILLIALIGVGLMRFGRAIENRFARWRN
jgi:ABC-type nitrate/sulfonate/bicarbonate transport system permease component